MSDTRACIRGCTIRGQHLTDCSGDDCTGCLPRPAQIGWLCLPSHGRLTEDLGRIPDLITHVRDHVEPGNAQTDKVRGTKAPPAPMSLDAVDAADKLYAVLHSWSDTAEDELGLTPVERYGWATQGSGGQILGLTAGGMGDNSVALAHRLAKHLDRISEFEWVGDMAEEIHHAVRSALHRWPDEERPTYLHAPCPDCQMRSLVRRAPTWEGGPVTISCNRDACGATIKEELYDHYARVILTEKQQQAKDQAAQEDAGAAA